MNIPPFGTTLLIDKPLEWTSFDVVNKLRYQARRILNKKKVKVGHAGTLDPLATGLLIVCFGAHTKKINDLMGMDKSYTGTFRLGSTTPSYDLETEVDQEYEVPVFNAESLDRCVEAFTGEILQVPPIFSAKKVDGRKAYELARKSQEVKLAPANVCVHDFNINASDYPDLHFNIRCSKGTYIRSIAHDFGKCMGSGAHLRSLRRTAVGDFTIETAFTVDGAMTELERQYQEYLRLHSL